MSQDNSTTQSDKTNNRQSATPWVNWCRHELDTQFVDLAPWPVAGLLVRDPERDVWYCKSRGIKEQAALCCVKNILEISPPGNDELKYLRGESIPENLRSLFEDRPAQNPVIGSCALYDQANNALAVFFVAGDHDHLTQCVMNQTHMLARLMQHLLLRSYEIAQMARSVREHESLEHKLRDTHQQYLNLIDHLKETIFQMDSDGRWTFLNHSWQEMSGYTVAESLGSHFSRTTHPGDREVALKYFQAMAKGVDTSCRFELRYVARDGHIGWVEVYAQACKDAEGKFSGITGAMRDVTDRRRAEDLLRQKESILRAFFNCPGFRMGIFELHANELYYLSVNPSEAAALGIKAENIAGKSASDIGINRDLLAVWVVNVKEAQSRGLPVRFEYAEKEGTSDERWFGMTVCPMTESQAAAPHFSYVIEDITDRRRVQLELQAARLAAEHASKVKSEFLANMSHEIRTPMTAIVGFADMLMEEGQSQQERADCISTIQRNGSHLLRIINDILDISKIEAGMMQVETMQVPLLEILAEVESLMRPRAAKKQLDFRIELATPVPELIRSDPTRLRQIMVNLLSNAIKFTEKGSVRVSVEIPQNVIPPEARFHVIDTGPGIPQDRIGNLFEPFTQVDASVSRTHGGTGLGLTIARRLAEMLGGTISVHSTPGQGCIFTLTIKIGCIDGVRLVHTPLVPSVRPSYQYSDQLAAVRKISARVLLAEDSPDNQRLIRHHLVRVGAEVELAENGILARNKAIEAYRQGNAFDVILMDMQMPELDGYAATRQLRSRGYRGPIIALTASAMQGDRERCIEAGCDDFASKPIDLPHLLDLVETYAARRDAYVS